jgi:transposase
LPSISTVSAYVTKLVILVAEDLWLIVNPTRVKMSQKSSAPPSRVPAEKLVRDIRCATRKHHSAEDKIRIVPEGLGSKESIENNGK